MYKINTLLLSGGGAKGLAYCGLLRCLEELQCKNDYDINIDIKEVCGISIGSIFGLLYILGYKYEELRDVILRKPFTELKDIRISNFVNKFGLDSGKGIIGWLEELVKQKGYRKGVTLGGLYKKTGIHFKILAGNLQTSDFTTFDYMTTPDFKVLKAIRLSISLPFIFTNQKYNNVIHIDGGLIDNYPIWIYKNNIDNVLGVRLLSYNKNTSTETEVVSGNTTETLDKYIYDIMKCYSIQREKIPLDCYYLDRTILMYTNQTTGTINFEMVNDEKQKLMDIGYDSTMDFFKKYKKNNGFEK